MMADLLPIGSQAPDFCLPAAGGQMISLVLQLYLLRWGGTPLIVTTLGNGLMMSPPS